MALLIPILERSLDEELKRVSDPESRYLAARKIMDRFLRSLPLGSKLSKLFSDVTAVIDQMDIDQRQVRKNETSFLKHTHLNSSAYLINRADAELSQKVREYCEKKIDNINLAPPPKPPKIIVENRVTTRPGLESVPNFVKQIDASKATSVEYLTEMINNLNNEIAAKEQIKSELIETHVSNERIQNLRQSNEQLMKELVEQKAKRKVWKVALMTNRYLKTMNQPDQLVKKSDAIKMFLSGMGDGDGINDRENDHSVAISDPVDSQRAQEALELIRDFGNLVKQREFHPAAQLAVSNEILRSIHSFRRIIETKTEDAVTAGIWFASVLFEAGIKCSREFILESLKLAFESGMSDSIIPNWHSFGIFTPHRKIAKWLKKCGQYSIACQLYFQLEMYQQCAELLVKRNQHYQLVMLYKQKHISHGFVLNRFYESPNHVIGHALHSVGHEPIGQLLVNLATRGLGKAAVEFYKSFSEEEQDCIVIKDEITTQSDWDLVLGILEDDSIKSKILTQRALKLGVQEEEYNQRTTFDFYS